MLNVTSKSENETFLLTRICEFTETWVATQRDIGGHITDRIKARKSKSTEQYHEYDCKLFFRLDGTCNSNGPIIQLNGLRFWFNDQI